MQHPCHLFTVHLSYRCAKQFFHRSGQVTTIARGISARSRRS